MKLDSTWDALLRPASAGPFFPLGGRISPDALCAEMARLAYGDEGRIRSALSRVGFQLLQGDGHTGCFENEGTFAFLAHRDEAAVLAFRGTESADPKDAITDAQVFLEPWEAKGQPGGRVHRGFARALKSVWSDVEPALARVSHLPLLLTGHSLGAALATLAGSLVASASLYTYGCPRVGDTEFCTRALAGVESHRYVNCSDLVCKLPPEAIGYAHPGQLHYIDRHGDVSTTLSPTERDEDQFEARKDYLLKYAWRPGNALTRDLADHSPVNYVSALK